MLIQFLIQDEPELDRWQSGVLTANGQMKPSYAALRLPLAERVARRPAHDAVGPGPARARARGATASSSSATAAGRPSAAPRAPRPAATSRAS